MASHGESRGALRYGECSKVSAFVSGQLAIPLLEQWESGRQKLLRDFSPDSRVLAFGDTIPCVIPIFLLMSRDGQACLESTWNLDIN